MHPLTKEIIECNGQDALQKAMAIEDKDDIWNGCIQAMAIIATTTKEPPIELTVLWDLLLNELDQMMNQETAQEDIGLFISKLVLFYQRVQQYSNQGTRTFSSFRNFKIQSDCPFSLTNNNDMKEVIPVFTQFFQEMTVKPWRGLVG